MAEAKKQVFGLLAEFKSTHDLVNAAIKMREAGYTRYDCHSPFPVHGMDDAMGLGRSPVGYIVGICGSTGLIGFTLFLYWVTAVAYPMVISGKPFFSYQAYVPPIFAITILSSALAATFGMLALNHLPRLNHPLFSSKEFEKVTDGGFFVSVESVDSKFDAEKTRAYLESIGATLVETIGEEEEAAV